MIGYYTGEELSQMGFKKIGKNVKISKTATLYNVSSIKIGNNVRIDNFCVIALSGEGRLSIGNHVQNLYFEPARYLMPDQCSLPDYM